jgi:uncharacterized RDD family membrane protein YckC
MTTGEDYINRVIDRMPRAIPLRSQIAMDLRSHIAERVEHGQSLDDVVQQLGDPAALADSYLAAVPLTPASFLRRGAAKVIDLLLYVAICAPLVWLGWRAAGPFIFLTLLPIALLFPIYFVAAEYWFDQTAGKRLLGMRVVRESGARIGLGQSFVRQLPQVLQVFWIDVLFALFTDRHQRAFELLSHTRVVMVPLEEVSK